VNLSGDAIFRDADAMHKAAHDIGDLADNEEQSLKRRIMLTIARQGPLENVDALLPYLHATPGDHSSAHEVTHLLWSLQKQGRVRFRQIRNGTSGGELRTITATPAGMKLFVKPEGEPQAEATKLCRHCRKEKPQAAFNANARTPDGLQSWCRECQHDFSKMKIRQARQSEEERAREEEAEAIEAAHAVEEVEELPILALVPDEWPELEKLRERAASFVAIEKRAAAYMEAAALVEHHDSRMAEYLLSAAAEAAPTPLSSIEVEYLRFADR
jgi:hypothetical protein